MLSGYCDIISSNETSVLFILYYLSAGLYVVIDFYQLVDSKLVMAGLEVTPLIIMITLIRKKFRSRITTVVGLGLLLSGIANTILRYQQNESQFKMATSLFLAAYLIYDCCVMLLWFNNNYNQRIRGKQDRLIVVIIVLHVFIIYQSLLLQEQWSKNFPNIINLNSSINGSKLKQQNFATYEEGEEPLLLDEDEQDLILVSLADRNLRNYGPNFSYKGIYNSSPNFNQKFSYAITMSLYYFVQSLISYIICQLFQNEGGGFVSLQSS